jgi:ParB-like chromosome segregation protein Spo0J
MESESFRVRVEDLMYPANVPAGMDVLVLMSLAALLRKTTADPAPVRVKPEGTRWRVADGRHRALAAMIAGRVDVLCMLD